MELCHEFVNYIPKHLDDNVLYVSIRFGTVVHRCACGCGEEVVTPLGPAEWELTYDGNSVSLAPSIGNWNFPCRSHYWVDKGRVQWARGFSEAEVMLVRKEARTRRDGYYQKESDILTGELPDKMIRYNLKKSIWRMLRSLGRRGGG